MGKVAPTVSMAWIPSSASLVCRDLMHAWAPLTAKRVKTGYTRTLVCSRCATHKEQTLDRDGYITGSKMKYPDHYLRPPGEGRLTKDERADLRVRNLNA